MGAILNRSAGQEDRREKKAKRKQRQQQLELTFGSDAHRVSDGTVNEDSNKRHRDIYESWEKKVELQQTMNVNDPPGALGTYSSNYSTMQHDLMAQPWSSPLNTLPIAPSYNTPFISNQFNLTPDTYNHQPQTAAPVERLSKKVKFASTTNQIPQTSNSKPLTNRKSCHESSDLSVPTAVKSLPPSNRSSLRKPIEKPIYASVDFQATLVERGKSSGRKRHRRCDEPKYSDGSNSSEAHHQARSHTNHHRKNQTPIDSPRSNVEITPTRSFDSQRLIRKSLTSNKLLENSNRSPFMSYEIKPSKSHINLQAHSATTNERSSSKSREHHRRQYHEPAALFSNDSPLNIQSSTRRIEMNRSGAPMLRIPLSQLNRKPILISSATSVTKIHRLPIQT